MITIDKLIEEIQQRFEIRDVELQQLRRANQTAEEYLKDFVRENKEPFIQHPLNVAYLVVQNFFLSIDAIIAIFLHETEIKNKAIEINKSGYSDKTLQLTAELNALSSIVIRFDEKTGTLDVSKFKKLLASPVLDPQVVIIKLLDRLEVMRMLSFFSSEKRERKSHETLLLYAPLTHKLGLYQIKGELEDLSLRYIQPQIYRDISAKLTLGQQQRQQIFDTFINLLERELQKNGFQYTLKSRTKSIFSIYQKMQKQDVPFEQVFDLLALRIILNSGDKPEEYHQLTSQFQKIEELAKEDKQNQEKIRLHKLQVKQINEHNEKIHQRRSLLLHELKEKEKKECWEIYTIIRSLFNTDINRFRDWISSPKKSGYESLHTTVEYQGLVIEIQIRTRRMDENAEQGAASHWRYKGIAEQQSGMEAWMGRLRNVLQQAEHHIENYQSNEIFVFTPKGLVVQLPKDATVLDFAFAVHTQIGIQCTGGLRNQKNVSIKDTLSNGDIVQIHTNKNQHPKHDWLDIAITNKALSKIRQFLRQEDRVLLDLGREELERKLKTWKVDMPSPVTFLANHYKLKHASDLYLKIALREVEMAALKKALLDGQVQNKETKVPVCNTPEKKTTGVSTNPAQLLTIDSIGSGLEFSLGKCCNPIYGDKVFAFVTAKGIKIHTYTCPNSLWLLHSEDREKKIKNVEWNTQTESQFTGILRVLTNPVLGLIDYIMDTVAQQLGLNLKIIEVKEIPRREEKEIEAKFNVVVKNAKQLENIIKFIQKIKGVRFTERIVK